PRGGGGQGRAGGRGGGGGEPLDQGQQNADRGGVVVGARARVHGVVVRREQERPVPRAKIDGEFLAGPLVRREAMHAERNSAGGEIARHRRLPLGVRSPLEQPR